MDFHRLSGADLDDLAAARPTPGVAAALRDVQVSQVLLLACHLVEARPELSRAADVLAEAQRVAPEETRTLLAYPWVGAWAVACVRSTDLTGAGYLRNVAAAAAIRAGRPDLARDLLDRSDPDTVLPTLGPV